MAIDRTALICRDFGWLAGVRQLGGASEIFTDAPHPQISLDGASSSAPPRSAVAGQRLGRAGARGDRAPRFAVRPGGDLLLWELASACG